MPCNILLSTLWKMSSLPGDLEHAIEIEDYALADRLTKWKDYYDADLSKKDDRTQVTVRDCVQSLVRYRENVSEITYRWHLL